MPLILNLRPLRPLRSLLQRLLGGKYLYAALKTSHQILCEMGIEPASELGAVLLGQWPDAGMRPDKCSAMMHMGVMTHYANGSCYPKGGSGALPRKMAHVVRAAGGTCFVQARVSSLLVDTRGRCIGVNVDGTSDRGVPLTARVVVSGSGVLRSYAQLLRPIPHVAREAERAVARISKDTQLSCAFIFLFIGLDVSSQPESEVDHRSHNTWIYPDADHVATEETAEAHEPWTKPMPMFVASGSAKDAGWATKFGKQRKTVVVLSSCPWAWVEPWAHLTPEARAKDKSYAAFKQSYQEAAMAQGFRCVFPHLEKYIVHTNVGTPLSTNTYLATEQGECYGRSATPTRWLSPDLSPYTPLANFYLTGQDVVTLGLTGAIFSGYLTACAIAGYGSWQNILLMREITDDLGLQKIF